MIGYDEVKKEENTGIIVKNEPVSDEEQEVDEVLETKYSIKDENPQSQEDNLYVNLQETVQRCAYCYECSELMVPGPSGQAEMDQWIEELGRQFENNLYQFSTHPVICKSHFHVEDFNAAGDKILRTAIPYANPFYEGRYFENGQIMKYTSCAYCGAFSLSSIMRLVPSHLVTRGLWCRKLGDKFQSRIENEPASYICESHFLDKKFSSKSRNLCLALPSTLEEKRIEYPLNCVYCYNVDHCDNMIPVPVGVDRKIWIDELGERFEKSLKLAYSPSICKSHFGDYDERFNSDGPQIPLADEYILELEMKHMTSGDGDPKVVPCAYCGSYCSIQKAAIVPLDEDILEKWTNVLGDRFAYNLFKTITPWICKKHFFFGDFDEDGLLRKGALPIANDAAHKFEDAHYRYMVSTTCAYCEKKDVVRKMRFVVACPFKRNKWVSILGEKFGKNILCFTKSAICRSHFCVGEWKDGSERYSTVPHRDKNRVDTLVNFGTVYINKRVKFGLGDITETINNFQNPDSFKQELNEMYEFGWKSSNEMKAYHQNAIMDQLLYRNEYSKEQLALKCIYCFNTPSKFIILSRSFRKLRDKWDNYSKEFGLQFTSRLRRSDLQESIMKSYPHLILCKRHINSKKEPVPDKNFHYSVDELLDHTYANFSHYYLTAGTSSQR